MITDELVSFETAKLAKEKGFDVPTDFCYEKSGNLVRVGSISAPTQSLLQRWLREEERIEVNAFWDSADCIWFSYAKKMDIPDLVGTFMPDGFFISYESAIEDALKYALENLI